MPRSRRASPARRPAARTAWRAGSRGARCAAACALAALLLVAAPAHAAAPNPCAGGPANATFAAAANRLGVVDLFLFGPPGVPVSYFECVGERATALGTSDRWQDGVTALWAATSWRCVRLERRFAATATLPDGTVLRGADGIRTRSCAQRFELAAPRRIAPGGRARVRFRDRWGVGGVRTKLCTTRPGGRAACVRVKTDAKRRTRTLRLRARGLWRVELRAPGAVTRLQIAVGVRAPAREARPPTLLAAGDSTMDGIDGFLADELGDEATVVSEVEPGIAISRANGWQRLAVEQVARLRPATTVISIGANEGWPMRGADGAVHECCDEPWVAEYARRVRETMLTYRRRVFWLTLVAPRDPRRVPIFAAVNAAIARAAQGLAAVRIVRLDLLFSPHGYRDTIRDGGRDVRVREADGIHLNVAGTRIAAREVARAIRSG